MAQTDPDVRFTPSGDRMALRSPGGKPITKGSLFGRPGRVLNDERRSRPPGGYGAVTEADAAGPPTGGPVAVSEQDHPDGFARVHTLAVVEDREARRGRHARQHVARLEPGP